MASFIARPITIRHGGSGIETGGTENLLVEVLAVTGRQGFARGQPEGAVAVGLALRAEEERRRVMLRVAAFRQVVLVGDEDDPDPGLGQRADDLAGDLGTLTFVGGRERLVAEQQAPGRDLV